MLKKATIVFVLLCLLGGIYEFTLRDKDVLGSRQVLRITAAGWMISEFKLYEHVQRFGTEHPEIQVRLQQSPQGFDNILMLQASIGEVPYDLYLGPSNYSVDRFCQRGLAVALDDLIPQEVFKRIFPGMLAASQWKAKTYLLPFMAEVEVLNYRKDLFAQAGLTRPPESWEELARYAGRLTDPKSDRYGMSLIIGHNFFFLQNGYVVLLRSFAGTAVDEKGHLDVSSPAAEKVFRTLKGWLKAKLISPASKTKDGAPDDFTSGITAMFPNWQSRGQWALRSKKMKGKIAFAPLPTSKTVGSLFAIHGGMILKGSKMQKQAAAFLTEVMLGCAQKDVIAAGKMPVTHDMYTTRHVPQWMVEVGRTLANSYSAPEPVEIQEIAEHVAVAFQDYLNSDSDDPAPFLAKARQQIQRRIYSRQR